MLILAALCLQLPLTPDEPLFELAERVRTPDQAPFRLLRDFDGDGLLDALSVSSKTSSPSIVGAEFQIHLGDGAGGFTPAASTVAAFTGSLLDLAVADFTGDGLQDFVLRTSDPLGNSTTSWLRGVAGPGFAPLQSLDTELGLTIASLVAVEFDGDPSRELAIHRSIGGAASRVVVYTWTPGGWQIDTSSPARIAPAGPLLAADLDGDGLQDLVARDETGAFGAQALALFLNQSSGLRAPVLPPITVNEKDRLVVADLDADGDRDLVVAGGASLRVLRNPGNGLIYSEQELPFSPGREATISGPARHAVMPVDIDGDGFDDLVGTLAGGFSTLFDLLDESTETAFMSFAGGPDGPLAGPDTLALQLTVLTGSADGSLAGVADLNGDGLPEIVGARDVLDGRVPLRTPRVEFLARTLKPADLDLDGDIDVMQRNTSALNPFLDALLNDASASLTPSDLGPPVLTRSSAGIAIDADLDADGLPEMLIAEWIIITLFQPAVQTGWRRFELQAGGAYEDLGLVAPGNVWANAPVFVNDVAFARDVNGDGHEDLVTAQGYLPGDGTGALGVPVQVVSGGEFLFDGLDWDSDGDFDLLSWSDSSGGALTLYRAGPSGYSPLMLLDAGFVAPQVAIVDLDGDGDLDLVCVADDPLAGDRALLIVVQDPGGFTVVRVGEFSSPNVADIALDDFDGDGLWDLAVAGTGPQPSAVEVYAGLGSGLAFAPARYFPCPDRLRFGDLDADGDEDLIGSGRVARARVVEAPDAARLLQYGIGSAGSLAAVPLLGAKGQFTPGSPNAQLRLVGAAPSSFGALAVGLAATELPDLPLAGLTLLVQPPTTLFQVSTDTTGAWTPAIQTFPTTAGLSFYGQAFVVDPGAPSGLSASNGLALTFGL